MLELLFKFRTSSTMAPLPIAGLAWLVLHERLTPKFLLLPLAAAGLVIGTDFGQPCLLVGNALIFNGVL